MENPPEFCRAPSSSIFIVGLQMDISAKEKLGSGAALTLIPNMKIDAFNNPDFILRFRKFVK
jgi:hypothetical protein